jgi:hypothetical protein
MLPPITELRPVAQIIMKRETFRKVIRTLVRCDIKLMANVAGPHIGN